MHVTTPHFQGIVERKENLQNVAAQCKTEFFGVEPQIDNIINNLRPIYLLPESIRKPCVLCEWGPTGVGKTAVTRRIIHLLNMEQNFQYFDAGSYNSEENGDGGLDSEIRSRLAQYPNQSSLILFFDDVHLIQTYDEMYDSVTERPAVRVFWELLNSGIISIWNDEKECYEERDFSKSLIILAGNLNGLYSESYYVEADYDADVYYEMSKKHNISDVKAELFGMFRPEEVGRMGNAHIIFPYLPRKAFESIITTALSEIQEDAKKQFGLTINFDKTVNETLYSEGVYPAQGARALLSTIKTVIDNYVARILVDCAIDHAKTEEIIWKLDKESSEHICELDSSEILKYAVELPTHQARLTTNASLNYQIAVHEAGHVVGSLVLMRTCPLAARLNMVQNGAGGEARVEFGHFSVNSIELQKQVIAMGLCGHLAEETVFGHARASIGNGSDLQEATRGAMMLVKLLGNGANKARITQDAGLGSSPMQFSAEQDIMAVMTECTLMAKKCVTAHLDAIVAIAYGMIAKGVLEPHEIRRIAEKYLTMNLLEDIEAPHDFQAILEEKAKTLSVNYDEIRDLING